MMHMDKEERIKAIQKEIIKVSVLESPGTILLGLGLYAKFAANGDAFIPLLNNQDIVNAILILGGAIIVWGASRLISLSMERVRLQAELDKNP